MKTFLTLFTTLGISFGAVTAFSQDPVAPLPPLPAIPPAAPAIPGAPVAAAPANLQATLIQLKAIRDQNAKMIEQQNATIKQLEEMEKVSQQLKFFGKRS
jgi:hypothetical protein